VNRNLFGIYLVTSLSMAGVFTLSPVLPEVASALQIEGAQVSYIIAAFTLGNVCVAPFIGLLADRLGRKKIVIPSLYLFGLAGFCSGAVDSLEAVIGWRFLQGIGSAALGTLSITMIADLYEGPQRVRYFGYNMAVNSIGMVLFPLLGAVLVLYSWRFPFYASALAIPVALYNQFFLSYEEKLNPLNTRDYINNLLRSLADRRVLLAAYLNFTSFIMLGGAFLTFYALFFAENLPASLQLFGSEWAREVVAGLAMSLFSIVVGVVSFKLGAIHARIGFHRVLGLAFLSYAGSLYLFQASTSLSLMLLAVMWLGAAHGTAMPSIVALYTRLAPAGMTASYVSLNSLVFRLGQTLGPVLMAAVYMVTGDLHSVFQLAAMLGIPAAAVAYSTRWRGQQAGK
jgi:MFS family permease